MTSAIKTLTYKTTARTDILDITEDISMGLEELRAADGIAVVFVPGSTASITTIEFESGAVNDLRRAIEKLAPQGPEYEHDRRWGDMNGYAHVRAALLGPSLALPVVSGRPALGTWQQIVLCDFDNRPRERTVLLRFVGS